MASHTDAAIAQIVRAGARYGGPMAIVDDLLANTGLYVGIDSVTGTEHRGAARVLVTALPGDSGVTLDYEILNPAMPDRIRGHVEHTIIGRVHDGGKRDVSELTRID